MSTDRPLAQYSNNKVMNRKPIELTAVADLKSLPSPYRKAPTRTRVEPNTQCLVKPHTLFMAKSRLGENRREYGCHCHRSGQFGSWSCAKGLGWRWGRIRLAVSPAQTPGVCSNPSHDEKRGGGGRSDPGRFHSSVPKAVDVSWRICSVHLAASYRCDHGPYAFSQRGAMPSLVG